MMADDEDDDNDEGNMKEEEAESRFQGYWCLASMAPFTPAHFIFISFLQEDFKEVLAKTASIFHQ